MNTSLILFLTNYGLTKLFMKREKYLGRGNFSYNLHSNNTYLPNQFKFNCDMNLKLFLHFEINNYDLIEMSISMEMDIVVTI